MAFYDNRMRVQVKVVCGDSVKQLQRWTQDVIMFDPPWGGTDYASKGTVHCCMGVLRLGQVCK